jgi:uncharacterized protein (DUF1697 family)
VTTRYVAFLRAINVGGHTVRMEVLRELFEQLGFTGVETFIASGNVVFETDDAADADASATAGLERRLGEALQAALGYEVVTFVRGVDELAEIAAHEPFPPRQVAAAHALNIAFTGRPLDEAERGRLMALTTGIDTFAVHGREVYWLCRTRQSESAFSNAVLEKTLGRPSTVRGATTVRKMAAKWGPGTV